MPRVSIPLLLFPLLLAGPGCFGLSGNANYPATTTNSPVEFNPAPVKLEVKPLQSDSPTRTELVLIATLTDSRGKPCPRHRIEWNLEGVGNVVEVDGGGFLQGYGKKTNNSAVTYTGSSTYSIGRHNGNVAEEIMIEPGQTWCLITSAVEGETAVTISAPDIRNWDNKRVVATRRWIDADWQLPTPAVGPAGSHLTLTTSVMSRTDHQPLPGYQVHYRLLDGPPAQFQPNLGGDATVTSDGAGHATVTLFQPNPTTGRNRVAVEILRPATTRGGVGPALTQGEAVVEWQQPGIMLRESCPESAVVGQDVKCTFTLTNTTLTTINWLELRAPLIEGANFVSSTPRANQDHNQLVWTLDSLPSNRPTHFEIVYHPPQPGLLTGKATVTSKNGMHDERTYQVKMTALPQPRLHLEPVGTFTALLTRSGEQVQGQPVSLQLVVSNVGTDPALNTQLHVDLDPGLQAESGQTALDWTLGTLTPGLRRSIPMTLRATKPGTASVRATVSADSGPLLTNASSTVPPRQILAKIEQPYSMRETGLDLKLSGPAVRFVGKPFHWDLDLHNPGTTPLTQITVSTLLPPQLDLVEASDNGRLQGSEVVWVLDRLEPGTSHPFKLRTSAHAMAPRAVLQARASAVVLDQGTGQLTSGSTKLATIGPPVVASTEAAIELQGIPAFKLRVEGKGPIEVSENLTYTIVVENTGSLPGTNIQVAAIVPPEMKLLAARGTNYRVDATRVTFAPIPSILPNQKMQFTIDVQAEKPGDARFRAELTTGTHAPVAQENSIHIVPRGD